jgi:integrase/recombinase XerD
MPSQPRTRTVTLALRVRLASGDRRYVKPVVAANRQLKPLMALVDGRPEHHPEGVYALRYKSAEGKNVWESVGPDPQHALLLKKQREIALHAEDFGMRFARPVGTVRQSRAATNTRVNQGPTLTEKVNEFLEDVAFRNRKRTVAAYTISLTLFLSSCPKATVEEVTTKDVDDYVRFLRLRGNGDRTAANRVTVLRTFLRWAKVEGLITRRLIPTYTEKTVAAYSARQVQGLLAAAAQTDKLLWQFFLGSGGREQEVMYATWRDIDFDDKVFRVREKADLAYTIKDHEERDVPLSDSLLHALKLRRLARPADRLLFPTRRNKPDGRKIKKTALRGGLNCGHCVNKVGRSCREHPVCDTWELHRLRKTFATMHHESGVSARTLMKWLGHADLETVLKYLESADIRSDKTRAMVNRTFSAFE